MRQQGTQKLSLFFLCSSKQVDEQTGVYVYDWQKKNSWKRKDPALLPTRKGEWTKQHLISNRTVRSEVLSGREARKKKKQIQIKKKKRNSVRLGRTGVGKVKLLSIVLVQSDFNAVGSARSFSTLWEYACSDEGRYTKTPTIKKKKKAVRVQLSVNYVQSLLLLRKSREEKKEKQ